MWRDQLAAHPMVLAVQLQLNPHAKPFIPTVKKANKLLQHRLCRLSSIVYRGKREEGDVPISMHQTQLGRVRCASRCGEEEPNSPRETKTSGANGDTKQNRIAARSISLNYSSLCYIASRNGWVSMKRGSTVDYLV